MTNIYVIRNIRQRDKFIDQLKGQRLPFKALVQDMYPVRTLDQNAYLFGVVYKMIADEVGHSVDEIHEYLSLKFRISYYFDSRTKQMVFERTSTTQDNINSFWDYVEQVSAWSWQFLHIQIPHPSEVIIQDQINEIKL